MSSWALHSVTPLHGSTFCDDGAMRLAQLVDRIPETPTPGGSDERFDDEADEGTAAHLWQLLMVGQVPLVAYFALIWLPRSPGKALRVLALQLVAALAA